MPAKIKQLPRTNGCVYSSKRIANDATYEPTHTRCMVSDCMRLTIGEETVASCQVILTEEGLTW